MLGDIESLFQVDESEPVAEEPQIEVPEETGFAPEPEQTVVSPPLQAPVETPPNEGKNGQIPIDAYLTEREKRQRVEREASELRQTLAQLREQQAGESPTIYDDPVAYQENLQAQRRADQFQIREEMSDRFAKQTHGEAAVTAAEEWGLTVAKSDPTFSARYLNQSDPKGWLIAEHKRDLIARDPDAFARKWAEDNGFVASQAPAAPAPTVQSAARPAPAAPPRSIASAPSSSGATHVPITSVMEAVRFNLG